MYNNIIIDDDKETIINESCSIILKNKNINIKYDFNNGDYFVLVFSDLDENVILNENGDIDNSNVSISYLLLDKNDLIQNSNINVNSNSNLSVNTTYLAVNKKNIVFNLINSQHDTTININNNIVCLERSEFSLDCIGTIKKGAKRSKCYQKTNCLTVDNPKSSKVIPILNIDEDDVEASHSLSSGTIDEDVLFYMNSRGLKKSEALNLIIRSYLIPDDEFYSNYENGKYIQDLAIRKVENVCLM